MDNIVDRFPVIGRLKISAIATGLTDIKPADGDAKNLKRVDDFETEALKIIDKYGEQFKEHDQEILDAVLRENMKASGALK